MARLDVGARALLDLWLRQDIDDEEIAAVLGGRPGDVAERRAQILHRLMFETRAAPGPRREGLLSELRSILAEGGPALVHGLPEGAPADDAAERSSAATQLASSEGPEAGATPEPATTDVSEEESEAPRTAPQAKSEDEPVPAPADRDEAPATEPTPSPGAPEATVEQPAPEPTPSPAAPEATVEPPAQPTSQPADPEPAQPEADSTAEAVIPSPTPPIPPSPSKRSQLARERRVVIRAAAILLVSGAVVAGALLWDRTGADPPDSIRPGADPAPTADDLPWVEFDQLPAAGPPVEGMAALTGEGRRQRLHVRVSGLPEHPARYRVWLARPPSLTPVGRLRYDGTLSAPLSADSAEFRFLRVLLDRKWGGARGALSMPTDRLVAERPARRGAAPAN